ncbi:hypothetical protein [Sinirhodobacter huangdaonensis]|uniref:Uncharacterized protein n=1 Tax=Paenirhodobacter huangdaonensis TaxID=2501515 RepID=A0A3S3LPD4_9RHOB|nr:hypothetical protein [Sinirhodobacter huangdaonensis]RWR54029.1 hypothetical protein EOW66_05300 [Sinirhodobacter huangdaonensis]
MANIATPAWPNSPNPPMGQPEKKRVRVKLDTVSDIKAEAAKLYRLCRSGEVDPSEAGKLAYLLQIVAKLTETSDLEARLAELETERS